jgi:hypothetical protein
MSDKMQSASPRRRPRRQRLDALALARQQQPGTTIAQRRRPIGVTDHAHKTFDTSRKPPLRPFGFDTHPSPRLPINVRSN